ncbi:dTDP-4-amino-4,6-dideoxygalactose transaminase [Rhizobium sp. ZK1]|uniref:dTDP-4-amino-4,6-dideoxygalactose transaminase n=1 Tax=Rhizobium sp. ZK1 TaxID=3389872 RepID=UPI0039F6734C
MAEIPFNRSPLLGREKEYVEDAIGRRRLSGDGFYTKAVSEHVKQRLGAAEVYLTHSCTAALEMAALLIDLGPGDEVIMPSFTFTSTANAVALRGAKPVFADVSIGSMNIDLDEIEALLTPATKAILVVHYAGRVPDMDRVNEFARERGLVVIEDAAQSYGSFYKGSPSGTHSALSTISFHDTKNITAGEGGALVINDPRFIDRAAVLREKGTNRQQFLQGQTDKYTWIDLGSSYLPSELTAAFLLAQLECSDTITDVRRDHWKRYREGFERLTKRFSVTLPDQETADQPVNGHIFHILLPDSGCRPAFLAEMKARGVNCTFHYVPLHSAPAGLRFGVAPRGCPVTEDAAARLVRLPLFYDLTPEDIDYIVSQAASALGSLEN